MKLLTGVLWKNRSKITWKIDRKGSAPTSYFNKVIVLHSGTLLKQILNTAVFQLILCKFPEKLFIECSQGTVLGNALYNLEQLLVTI